MVRGRYELIDADGYKRIVEYWADDRNGFQAIVRRVPSEFQVPWQHNQIAERLRLDHRRRSAFYTIPQAKQTHNLVENQLGGSLARHSLQSKDSRMRDHIDNTYRTSFVRFNAPGITRYQY